MASVAANSPFTSEFDRAVAYSLSQFGKSDLNLKLEQQRSRKCPLCALSP